jgi:hypothetical protein
MNLKKTYYRLQQDVRSERLKEKTTSNSFPTTNESVAVCTFHFFCSQTSPRQLFQILLSLHTFTSDRGQKYNFSRLKIARTELYYKVCAH